MDRNEELKEANKDPEVIEIGQIFTPFDPEKITNRSHNERVITLNINNLLDIKITISTLDSLSAKSDAVTPFNPKNGYQIDEQDLNLETRLKKIEEMRDLYGKNIDDSLDPVYINFESYELPKNIFIPFNDFSETLKDEFMSLFKRLRLQLSFMGERFRFSLEAQPSDNALFLGELLFDDYYPLDNGPLPSSDTSLLENGFGIFVPDDLEKLKTIKAKFVLLEDPNEKNEEFEEDLDPKKKDEGDPWSPTDLFK